MEKTNKKILEEIIRVDHAGERGAIKIYEGQLLALKTIKQDESLKEKIELMKEHELGFGTVLMGKKAAMLCTASVEEVIEDHYESQIKKLGNDEINLKSKIEKFKNDEIQHKNIAYESGATNKGFYGAMDKIIKTGSRIAITISEKI